MKVIDEVAYYSSEDMYAVKTKFYLRKFFFKAVRVLTLSALKVVVMAVGLVVAFKLLTFVY